MRPHPTRRHFLGCCGAAATAGLFTSLQAQARCSDPLPVELMRNERVQQALAGLDPSALWDVHAHLLGTGDSGSGCSIHEHMSQWWRPLEFMRRRVILGAACVEGDAPSVDRAYAQRLQQLAAGFPPGARWLLYAFDHALDERGRERPDWTTFHVPNAYAAKVAASQPDRFEWVASIHPYREDALARLDAALSQGARAVKWLPSAMNIDLRDARCTPFYARLAATGVPLIVHCGEEKAVPGAGRDELGNPLLVRSALAQGVRVIVAHCASLGAALDLDQKRPAEVPAFSLFARLMAEADAQPFLYGDVSALFQTNRTAATWRAVLANTHWHGRLMYGSDYPLPGIKLLFRLGVLVEAGLIEADAVETLHTLREHNPLLFNLVLLRQIRWRGQGLSATVFDTRRHFQPMRAAASNGGPGRLPSQVAKVSAGSTS